MSLWLIQYYTAAHHSWIGEATVGLSIEHDSMIFNEYICM
jgi:hypothetical protein